MIYSKYDTAVYRDLIQNLKDSNVQISKFDALIMKSNPSPSVTFRHDIDTKSCIENMSLLLDIDYDLDVESGIYLRVDYLEYDIKKYKSQILYYKNLGFEIGLHTSCYIEDDYIAKFKHEIEEFEDTLGYSPKSFTVHGLGDFRYDTRMKFYYYMMDNGLNEFGLEFTDCCPQYVTYSHVIHDCHLDSSNNKRYIEDDFTNPIGYINKGGLNLVLTHPCYWDSLSKRVY